MTTPFPQALRALAEADPHAPAITDASGTMSRGELEALSNRTARAFAEAGVGLGDFVSISLPSDRRFLVAAIAAWKLGATPQPLSSRMAPAELCEVLELTGPALVVSEQPLGGAAPAWSPATPVDGYDDGPLPAVTSPSWKAPTSGGSTGRPKVIVSTTPAVAESVLALGDLLRIRDGEVLLTPAPLHHNGPFLMSSIALLRGGHAVLMERFDPQRVLDLVAEHRVGWLYTVPTILSRIAKLPATSLDAADLSSVHTVFHLAAPCPEWLKRWWIDRLGADRVWELYAGTEVQAITVISGAEWLQRPGSVGRPVVGEIRVLGDDLQEVPAGTVGEVYLRSTSGLPTYRYLGATAKAVDGWETLGDMGSVDEEGYLYLADRRTDMVLVGGVNVYPAEVEAALDEHPAVASSCVVGLPDEDLGNRLHAVVQVAAEVADDELRAFLAERLAPHKVPRVFERVEEPLRDEAGKVRRSAVRAARLEGVRA